jgi:hypothetical protein
MVGCSDFNADSISIAYINKIWRNVASTFKAKIGSTILIEPLNQPITVVSFKFFVQRCHDRDLAANVELTGAPARLLGERDKLCGASG